MAGQTDSSRQTLEKRPDLIPRLTTVTEALLLAQHDEATRSTLIARAAGDLFEAGKVDEANAYLGRLVGEYPTAGMTQFAMSRHCGNRVLKVGSAVPAFRFVALAHSIVSYTPDQLKGKVYLIDFLATWCSPCVAERPALRKAYARFKDLGFEILSVSADDSRKTVAGFRTDRECLVQCHRVGGAVESGTEQFEIAFLPRSVLIDRNGKLVATDGQLRGAELETTLARVLPSDSAK